MNGGRVSQRSFKGLSSTGGLAAPVSMLIVFFSLTMVSTITYYYAISRIDSRKGELNFIAAEEKMLDLEEAISSTAWSPGSARVLSFSDYGGALELEPTGTDLMINITFDGSNEVLFNSSIGEVFYQLHFTHLGPVRNWLRGDGRAIVNESASSQAQVHIVQGTERYGFRVAYRPLVSSSVGSLQAGRRVNNIRIYLINLNESQELSSKGEFYLKSFCSDVTDQVHTYNLTSSIASVKITSRLNGSERTLIIPVESGPSGSTVRVELLVSHITFGRVRV